MSTLKQLRLRITGVKSTQKITKTMKMVAASKLVKAQDQKDSAKPYADKMFHVVSQLVNSSSLGDEVSNLLTGNGKNNVHLIVAISSDRGLCGGFNGSIAKMVKKQIKTLQAQDKKFKILCVGKKSFDQIKSLYRDDVIEVLPGYSSKKLHYADAKNLATKIIALFNQNEFDVCSVVYSEFKNALKQEVRVKQIIPSCGDDSSQAAVNYLYEYEPKEDKLLQQLLPLNIAVQIYYILLESIASEHGARMTAMDSATNNANDMIARLTLLYNRSRQASITRELIEIISSAEVL
jgi:F-type H+-transporting ATPase subunit gamma